MCDRPCPVLVYLVFFYEFLFFKVPICTNIETREGVDDLIGLDSEGSSMDDFSGFERIGICHGIYFYERLTATSNHIQIVSYVHWHVLLIQLCHCRRDVDRDPMV